MLFLWVYGPNVEAAWARSLPAYLILGIAAGLLLAGHDARDPLRRRFRKLRRDGRAPVLFARARLRVFYLFWWGVAPSGIWRVPVWIWTGIWIAEQLFWMQVERSAEISLSVAFMAHVGGFAAGLVFAAGWTWLFPRWTQDVDLAPQAADADRIRALLSAAEENIRSGHVEAARRAVADLVKLDPRHPLPGSVAHLRPRD